MKAIHEEINVTKDSFIKENEDNKKQIDIIARMNKESSTVYKTELESLKLQISEHSKSLESTTANSKDVSISYRSEFDAIQSQLLEQAKSNENIVTTNQ